MKIFLFVSWYSYSCVFVCSEQISRASSIPELSYIAKPAASWLDDFLVWTSPEAFGCCRKFVNGTYCPPDDQVWASSTCAVLKFKWSFSVFNIFCQKGSFLETHMSMFSHGTIFASTVMHLHTHTLQHLFTLSTLCWWSSSK